MKTKIPLILLLLTMGARGVMAQDSWTQKASFPGGARYGAVGICIGDKCYAGLGLDDAGNYYQDFWEFDPANDTWTRKADFPGGARTSAAGFTIGNKGYIGTGAYTPGDFGWIWYNDLWEYDPATNTWTQKASFGERGRYLSVGFTIGGKGYMGTGAYRLDRSVPAIYLNDFWEYDPIADAWTQKASVPTEGRDGAMGMAIGNKGYVGLGYYYYDTRKDDIWEYDPATNLWTQKANFGGGPRVEVTAFSIGNKGYVGNGGNYGYVNDFWEYNPATNVWTKKNDFPGGTHALATVFSTASKGYIGMGANTTSSVSDVWEYSPCGDPIFFYPSQLFCHSPTNRYGLMPFLVQDLCGTSQVSYTITGPTTRSGTGTDASGFFNPGVNKLTWTIVSASGKVFIFDVNIVVSDLKVRILDSYAVNPGGAANTIYVGYGPSSLTLTAEATDPLPGNIYPRWSNAGGEVGATTTVNLTEPGTYTYWVVANNQIPCEVTDTVTIKVVDVRCGNRLRKVEVCMDPKHRHAKSNCVDEHAVSSLLRKGATLGNCSCGFDDKEHHADAIAARADDEEDISVYPNPNGGSFILRWINLNASPARIQIIDRFGNETVSQSVNIVDRVQSVPIEMPASANGVYVIKIVSDTGIKTKKIVVQK